MQSIIQSEDGNWSTDMTEQWKDISGYEGLYQVSNKGRVRRLKKWNVGKMSFVDDVAIQTPTDNGNGYQIVGLVKDRQRKNHYVHRLVAEAFIEKKPKCNVINHLDHDRKNNVVSNLEWCTQKENTHYSIPLMRHPRETGRRASTGEKYIYWRESRGKYRAVVYRKEIGEYDTLEQAVFARNKYMAEVSYPCQSQ